MFTNCLISPFVSTTFLDSYSRIVCVCVCVPKSGILRTCAALCRCLQGPVASPSSNTIGREPTAGPLRLWKTIQTTDAIRVYVVSRPMATSRDKQMLKRRLCIGGYISASSTGLARHAQEPLRTCTARSSRTSWRMPTRTSGAPAPRAESQSLHVHSPAHGSPKSRSEPKSWLISTSKCPEVV